MTDGDALIAKPFRDEDLLRALAIVWEIKRDGRASPPYPRGFHLLPRAPAPRDRGAST
jgi:hypothetical protein